MDDPGYEQNDDLVDFQQSACLEHLEDTGMDNQVLICPNLAQVEPLIFEML
jgi:hypothetical protein